MQDFRPQVGGTFSLHTYANVDRITLKMSQPSRLALRAPRNCIFDI